MGAVSKYCYFGSANSKSLTKIYRLVHVGNGISNLSSPDQLRADDVGRLTAVC